MSMKKFGGAKYNFCDMLFKSDADYVMTCDRDEVWLPDKMERTMATMKDLKRRTHQTSSAGSYRPYRC